jgi:hypothetical protein
MGLNVAEVAPGAFRVREIPLLNTSDKSSVPVPVVVPAKTANASVRLRAPETSKVHATLAKLPDVVPVSAAQMQTEFRDAVNHSREGAKVVQNDDS